MAKKRRADRAHLEGVSASYLKKRLAARRRRIEETIDCDREFPCPDDPSIVFTDTPAEFVHPTARPVKKVR